MSVLDGILAKLSRVEVNASRAMSVINWNGLVDSGGIPPGPLVPPPVLTRVATLETSLDTAEGDIADNTTDIGTLQTQMLVVTNALGSVATTFNNVYATGFTAGTLAPAISTWIEAMTGIDHSLYVVTVPVDTEALVTCTTPQVANVLTGVMNGAHFTTLIVITAWRIGLVIP